MEDIQATRRAMILDSLVQLSVHSMISEQKGTSGKEDIAFRKLLMEQLKELERDEFNQSIKKVSNESTSILGSIIREIREQKSLPVEVKSLPEPEQIEATFTVQELETISN